VKSEKGRNPRKDGSLARDQPHDSWRDTLGHRAKGEAAFGSLKPAPEVRERREREGAPIAGHGRPLERKSPGEHRRRSQNNIGDGLNGLASGANPWRRSNGEGDEARGLP
jgi:hypothetical protein